MGPEKQQTSSQEMSENAVNMTEKTGKSHAYTGKMIYNKIGKMFNLAGIIGPVQWNSGSRKRIGMRVLNPLIGNLGIEEAKQWLK